MDTNVNILIKNQLTTNTMLFWIFQRQYQMTNVENFIFFKYKTNDNICTFNKQNYCIKVTQKDNKYCTFSNIKLNYFYVLQIFTNYPKIIQSSNYLPGSSFTQHKQDHIQLLNYTDITSWTLPWICIERYVRLRSNRYISRSQ